MSEQPKFPAPPGRDDAPPHPSTPPPAPARGPVRTQGETAVDDAMGAGDNVH